LKDLAVGLSIVIIVIVAGIFTFTGHSIICSKDKKNYIVGCYVCQDGRKVIYKGEDGFMPRRKAMIKYSCTPVDMVEQCESTMEIH